PFGVVGEGGAGFGPLQQQRAAGCVGAVELDRAITAVAAQGRGLEAVLLVDGWNLQNGMRAVGALRGEDQGGGAAAVGPATRSEPPARHKFTSDPRQPVKPVPPCVAEHVDDVCPDVFREHEMIVQLLSPPEAFGTCGRERSEVATVPYGGVTLND